MKEIQIKKYVLYLFGISIFTFILNKLYFRPWVLENDFSGFILMLTYSIPNLIEAIIGTLLITGMFLQIRQSLNDKLGPIKDIYIRVLSVGIATIYVISQELTFHNLGGNNVYDPYDLFASIVGLIGTFVIIQIFGFVYELEND